MNFADLSFTFQTSVYHDHQQDQSALFNYLSRKIVNYNIDKFIQLLNSAGGYLYRSAPLENLLKFISPKLHNYKFLILEAAKKLDSRIVFKDIPPEFGNDYDIAKLLFISHVNIKYITDRNVLLKLMREFPHFASYLKNIHAKFVNDDGIAMEILLLHCSTDNNRARITENFRKDASLVDIYANAYWIIMYADESLKRNEEFVLKLIEKQPKSIQYVPYEWRNDRNFVEKAIEHNLDIFKYVSENVKNDRELVLKVLDKNLRFYEYISKELQHDEEIVTSSVKKNGIIYALIPRIFKENRDIALSAFVDGCMFNDKVLTNWINSRRQYQTVNSLYGFIFRNLPNQFKSDREFALRVVDLFGFSLKYFDKSFRADREIVMRAVKNYSSSIVFATKDLRSDKEILTIAVSKYSHFYTLAVFVPRDLRTLVEKHK